MMSSISQTCLSPFYFHCNVRYMTMCLTIYGHVFHYPLMIIFKITTKLLLIWNSNVLAIYSSVFQYTRAYMSPIVSQFLCIIGKRLFCPCQHIHGFVAFLHGHATPKTFKHNKVCTIKRQNTKLTLDILVGVSLYVYIYFRLS